MPVTPRRSTRGAIFTPSPFPSPSAIAPNTTFAWTSAPLSAALPPVEGEASSSKLDVAAPGAFPNPTGDRSYYSSYTRIVSHSGLTPRKNGKKPRANKGDEESRFAIGDGVLVDVEGGADGVGVLIRLWEEPDKDEDEEGDEDSNGGNDSARRKRKDENGDATEVRMMAEVHWCFRRKDLPGIMKNLTVEDNEVLLAASPIRPVTTTLPVALLVRTVPIYSLPFFVSQFAPTKSVVKGWTYVRQGIYWCAKAFDKGAKGGKVYRVDIDQWRDNGKQGLGWNVQVQEDVPEKPVDSSDSDSASEAGSAKAPDEGESSDSGSSGGEEEEGAAKPKRARRTKAKDTAKPRKRQKLVAPSIPMGPKAKATKGKRMPHPKLPSSKLPASIMDTEQLPSDPYQRALRLLHVGATPESLPCREEEFVDVLSKVEEGVESGGGGCLYIAGVPGTGKTATVHAVVKELKRKAEDGELPPFSYVEINGLKIPSPQHAYTVLWEAISGQKGCSTKTALRGLETHFERKTTGVRGPRANTYVVLMDELDQLLTAKQDVVYNFFNWPTMRDSQLFVVAVANRMDLPQHLAAKIKSRLGLQTLLFQPYDRQSLIEIVQSRLIPHPKSKAEHKVLQPDAIALAATKMAGTNGDARRVLDACRRAVEVALEPKEQSTTSAIHPVTAKEMMAVLNQMSSSPVALFLKQCSLQQKLMLAALVRCIRREGVPEIRYRSIKSDHDNLVKSLLETNDLLSNTELNIVFSSLISCNALSCGYDLSKGMDDRKVALGMEISEVGRVLMNEGEAWRRALAGT